MTLALRWEIRWQSQHGATSDAVSHASLMCWLTRDKCCLGAAVSLLETARTNVGFSGPFSVELGFSDPMSLCTAFVSS